MNSISKYLAAIYFLKSLTAMAGPPPSISYEITGAQIVITFGEGVTLPERNSIHKSLQTRVLYRSKTFPFEVALAQEGYRSPGELMQLCSQFIETEQVVACEVAPQLRLEGDEICVESISSAQPKGVIELGQTAQVISDSVPGCESIRSRNLPQLMKGQLSPLWAQEMVGIDLAIQWLSTAHVKTQTVPIALLDSGFHEPSIDNRAAISALADAQKFGQKPSVSHGTSVANLIAGPEKGIHNPTVNLARFYPAQFAEERLAAFDDLSETKVRLLNESMGGDFTRTTPIFLKYLEERGTVFVTAAGNNFPAKTNEYKRIKNAVVVSSLSPLGLISDFSVSGPGITVSAPSDYFILSKDPNGLTPFSGTSGATPLVTGALAIPMGILPDLNPTEVGILVKKTAMPAMRIGSDQGSDAAPMLNAYLMARVADRLRKKGFPKGREKLLADESSFDFSEEAKAKLKEAQILPKKSLCERQKFGELVRESFLLHPTSEAAKQLAELYREAGFLANSTYYQLKAGSSVQELLRKSSANDEARFLLTYVGRYNVPMQVMGSMALHPMSDHPWKQQVGKIMESNSGATAEDRLSLALTLEPRVRYFDQKVAGEVGARLLLDADPLVRKKAMEALNAVINRPENDQVLPVGTPIITRETQLTDRYQQAREIALSVLDQAIEKMPISDSLRLLRIRLDQTKVSEDKMGASARSRQISQVLEKSLQASDLETKKQALEFFVDVLDHPSLRAYQRQISADVLNQNVEKSSRTDPALDALLYQTLGNRIAPGSLIWASLNPQVKNWLERKRKR